MEEEHDKKPKEPARLILASASPRRAALMRERGYEFEVLVPPLDEPTANWQSAKMPTRNAAPKRFAEALSYFKARSVASEVQRGLILAGDTVVALGGQLFGKPVDRDDARAILSAITGTTHEVITGVTLLDAASADWHSASGRRMIRHDLTAVTMRAMSEREMEEYLDSGAWEGKAGAYGIQDRGDAFVTRIEGSFTNVVGLPMELLAEMLAEWPAS